MHLVAGCTGSDFYIWDPDDEARPVERMLRGDVTLSVLFAENASQPIEFWLYRIDLT
jgi:hypothetical protein